MSFPDGSPDAWVPESCVAADVLEDWDKKLEYCEAVCLLDMREVGTERSFLVKWADNRPVRGLLGCGIVAVIAVLSAIHVLPAGHV